MGVGFDAAHGGPFHGLGGQVGELRLLSLTASRGQNSWPFEGSPLKGGRQQSAVWIHLKLSVLARGRECFRLANEPSQVENGGAGVLAFSKISLLIQRNGEP